MAKRSLVGLLLVAGVAAGVGWLWPLDPARTAAPELAQATLPAAGPAEPVRATETAEIAETAERVAASPTEAETTPVVITGRAIDAFDQPLAGVRVDFGFGDQRAQGATQADGRFAVSVRSGAAANGMLVLRGSDLAPVAQLVDVSASDAQVDVGDVMLATGGSIAGVVVDAAGKPLPGAAVQALPAGGNAPPVVAELTASAATDANGEYRLTPLAPGSWRVHATADGCTAVTSTTLRIADGAETRADTLQLAAGVVLRGSVAGTDGRPIAGAAVRAGNERATSGADGRFVVEHLPPGACAVEVTAEGWLGWQQRDVDPTQELRVVMPAGLVVTGAVVDRSGAPIESFTAHARRLQAIRAVQQGPPAWQLQRRAGLLRQAAAKSQDAAAAARDQAVADEYEARLAALRRAVPPPSRIPADLAAPTPHAEGRFTLDRLDEGLYLLEVLAPAHEFATTEPFELRRDAPPPAIRIVLQPALALAGTVRDAAGAAVARATVEIVRVREGAPAANAAAPSRFGWLVGEPSPTGDTVCAVVTDRAGAFFVTHLPAGTYQLQVRHPRHCTATTRAFALRADGEQDVVLQRRPSLAGRVHGVPAGRAPDVHVTALGGASNLRTVEVDENGQYRFDALEPGEYVVRASLGDVEVRQADLVHALFAAGALPPPRDVVLAAGQDRTFDVTLPLPALGTVRGTVLLNGAPAAGCRVTLAVVDAARPLTAVADAAGAFVVREVPAGDAQLRVLVRSAGQQELHRATVAVPAGIVTTADVTLAAGSLAGRITSSDGTPAAQLNGDLLVLPGCSEVPADLAAHRREHRVHTVSVRAGAFRCDALTVGRALVIVRLRNRETSTVLVDVRAGSVAEFEIPAGRSKP